MKHLHPVHAYDASKKRKFPTRSPLHEGRRARMDDFWIQNGWYKVMRDGSKKLTQAEWRQGMGIREEAVRFLVEKVLRKDPRDITGKNFESNRLGGLLPFYNGSPYAALKEAGYDIHPWETSHAPHVYEQKSIRMAAVRWLVEKLKKDPRDIILEDFRSNRLYGLLNHYYNNSPYAALKEAGYDFHPWEMSSTQHGFYKSKENRIAAIRWLVDKLGKDPRDITVEDFYSNCLHGLLTDCYNGSPYDALKEAGLVSKADEAHMRSPRHTRSDSR